MSQRQRIILVTDPFYPDESATAHILSKVAGFLAEEFELLVLAGPESYEDRPHRNTAEPPVDDRAVLRTAAAGLRKNNLPEKIARFLLLTISLSWQTLRHSRRTDIVFTVTNPAPMLVALAVIRKFRPFRLVVLVHDVFPENAAAAGLIGGKNPFYRLIRAVFNRAYGSADALITIGRDMSEVIRRKVPAGADRITLIENWADCTLVEPIPRDQSMIPGMGLADKIVLQYAGNLGLAQGLLEFADLVSVVTNDALRFVFRGSGALSTDLHRAVRGRKSFLVEGPYARSGQSRVLGSCDIAVVILGPDMYGLGVPSKIYNILASGKPVLFLGPGESEIYRLIKSHDIGWAFDWKDGGQLIQWLNNLSIHDSGDWSACGARARALAETAFTEAGQLAKFHTLFHSLTQSRAGSPRN